MWFICQFAKQIQIRIMKRSGHSWGLEVPLRPLLSLNPTKWLWIIIFLRQRKILKLISKKMFKLTYLFKRREFFSIQLPFTILWLENALCYLVLFIINDKQFHYNDCIVFLFFRWTGEHLFIVPVRTLCDNIYDLTNDNVFWRWDLRKVTFKKFF